MCVCVCVYERQRERVLLYTHIPTAAITNFLLQNSALAAGPLESREGRDRGLEYGVVGLSKTPVF